MTFKELGLNPQLLDGIEAMGFSTATPIQERAIPVINEGRDLIACAQTGTGKTAAFLLPILHFLAEKPNSDLTSLILVPTRELAIQIEQQLEGIAYFTEVNFLAIYGGRDSMEFSQEKKALTRGANIIIATPGRLLTHLNLKYSKLDHLKHFILDEADRMLDMGFINDIKRIESYLPKKRQTIMFSATMPPKIKQLAKNVLIDPHIINIKVSKPAENVIQGVYKVREEQKLSLLMHILHRTAAKKGLTIVFSRTKASVKKIAASLKKDGFNAGEIHSDLEQSERASILGGFKSGRIPTLVATDILSRGIDVKNIQLVINYDVPGDEEDYIHRVGRTARASAHGLALTFISPKDQRKFSKIERLMKMKIPVSPMPKQLVN